MATYQTYRMFRGSMVGGGRTAGFSGYFGDNFKPTARTFKARTHKEATKKMDRFIRAAQITGSFFVKATQN